MPTRMLKKRGPLAPSKTATATRPVRAPLVALTVKVDRRTYQALDRMRQKQHRTMQDLLCEAVEMRLEQDGPPSFGPASDFECEYEPEPPRRAALEERRERLSVEPMPRRERAERWEPEPERAPRPRAGSPETPWSIKALLIAAVLAFLAYTAQAVQRMSGYSLPLWQIVGGLFLGGLAIAMWLAARRVRLLREQR